MEHVVHHHLIVTVSVIGILWKNVWRSLIPHSFEVASTMSIALDSSKVVSRLTFKDVATARMVMLSDFKSIFVFIPWDNPTSGRKLWDVRCKMTRWEDNHLTESEICS